MKLKRAVMLTTLLLAGPPALALGDLVELSVYDRTQQRELTVHWRDGRAYVAGQPGNEYQIKVRNRAGADVLAVVSVDGVNVVSGETASPKQSGYVLNRHEQLDINGWRKSLSHTAAFYFTALPESYAARTGRPNDVGVIGAAVFRRKPQEPAVSFNWPWARDNEAGPESQASKREAGSAQDNLREPGAPASGMAQPAPREERAARDRVMQEKLGTGHGRNETSHARQVSFERASEHPEEVITVYYDSRANLIAQGIIRPEPAYGYRRAPQPFPTGFVPDPPRRW